MTKAIPWWAVATAILGPVLLIGGFLIAETLQRPWYSPIRNTISQLAAHGANYPWIMTTALVGLGLCYFITAVGLRPVRLAGRVLLASGGVATLLIAVFRQPRFGYSLPHELAVILAGVTCCPWPALAWYRRAPALLLTRTPSLAAAGVSIGLAGWYLSESHGYLLGIAERCAAVAPPLWILAVVITTRHALSQTDKRGQLGRTNAPR